MTALVDLLVVRKVVAAKRTFRVCPLSHPRPPPLAVLRLAPLGPLEMAQGVGVVMALTATALRW